MVDLVVTLPAFLIIQIPAGEGGVAVFINASMALTLSAHTPRMQVNVHSFSADLHAELGYNMH